MAAGTSLAVIALNSTTGIVGQLRFVSFDWGLLVGFMVFAVEEWLWGQRSRAVWPSTVFESSLPALYLFLPLRWYGNLLP